jgi:hypothetical protein
MLLECICLQLRRLGRLDIDDLKRLEVLAEFSETIRAMFPQWVSQPVEVDKNVLYRELEPHEVVPEDMHGGTLDDPELFQGCPVDRVVEPLCDCAVIEGSKRDGGDVDGMLRTGYSE